MNTISGDHSSMMPGIGLNGQSPLARAGKLGKGAASFDDVYNMGVNSLKSSISEPFKTGNVGPTDSSSGVLGGVNSLIQEVDQKAKDAVQIRTDVLSGRSNNLHRAVIASQEAGVSFSLLVEVRNKLLETYQELMRLQV